MLIIILNSILYYNWCEFLFYLIFWVFVIVRLCIMEIVFFVFKIVWELRKNYLKCLEIINI